MSARPPRCFGTDSTAKRWLASARYAAPGSSRWCADCTRSFQKEMIGQGLCDHPDVEFVLDSEGTERGIKPAPQMALFEEQAA